MRAFIAVPLSEGLDLSPASGLLASAQEGLRMVREENRHLTLAFLGDLDEWRLPRLEVALEESVSRVPAFPYRLKGLGAFPGASSARVIWCGMEDPSPWRSLHAAVADALRQAGVEDRGSRFHPHITLARVPRGPPGDALVRLLRAEAGTVFGEGDCDRLQIVQSSLGPGGPSYKVLRTIPLRD